MTASPDLETMRLRGLITRLDPDQGRACAVPGCIHAATQDEEATDRGRPVAA